MCVRFVVKVSSAMILSSVAGTVYWTDSSLKVIKRVRMPFDGSGQGAADVVLSSRVLDQPTGISIDWVGE